MQKRDLIKDQIEQLGRVLGKALATLLELKPSGKVEEGIGITSKQLKSELDIDLEKIVALSKGELEQYLRSRNIAAGHFEILARYFNEIGKEKLSTDESTARTYLMKALELLDLEDTASQNFSFDRLNLKTKIENNLKPIA